MSSTQQSQRIECKFGTFHLQRTIPTLPIQNQPRLCIAYRILHPSLLYNIPANNSDDPSSIPLAPLLVVHGGPSLPSEYLTPLAHHIQNRAIILYDQLGCGWSSIPRQKEWYGVTQMSSDLEELVLHLRENWKVQSYHLLGHSLGGAIGYEFLKRQTMTTQRRNNKGWKDDVPHCLSFILSNASTNIGLSSSEQSRLFHEFQQERQQNQTSMPSSSNSSSTRHHPLQTKRISIDDEFFHTHICRTIEKPAELESALGRRGGMIWSANDYCASIESGRAKEKNNCLVLTHNQYQSYPPILILRGKYDFVTEICTRGWAELFANCSSDGNDSRVKEILLDDCAHYPHFEQPERYCNEIEKFCRTAESGDILS